MKAPGCFDGTQPFKVRRFIHSFQLIFHNDKENFSEDSKKVHYATSFLNGRAEKWIKPYLLSLTNQDPKYLLNNWALFEAQLFTLFGDPNEGRKAEAELDGLRMKEALGGNSRKPSFPTSLCITFLNYHQSFLSLRNEAFKEIKDVVEDDYISSPHLIHGNVELPPSSYHDSLEELWYEEKEPEESEPMMKIFPFPYHHYLDLLFKVKAEKLPPHCTCDHHIKLEGSLPPVGVIKCRESFNLAKLLFNRSTCPLCKK
ncbi:hypothetical protein O181_000142 [Austropuccinia psidii MF-1]|uniref:DUF4939 domain-containing protein n=1 Tax=Austropuccinia psidii MF-1 TaxID=1389203 RepID=A0A9Q3B895_9BASI|nr:hypothetical protein [Austropuccinia psidii MF-1]